jgi:hypothetical protein
MNGSTVIITGEDYEVVLDSYSSEEFRWVRVVPGRDGRAPVGRTKGGLVVVLDQLVEPGLALISEPRLEGRGRVGFARVAEPYIRTRPSACGMCVVVEEAAAAEHMGVVACVPAQVAATADEALAAIKSACRNAAAEVLSRLLEDAERKRRRRRAAASVRAERLAKEAAEEAVVVAKAGETGLELLRKLRGADWYYRFSDDTAVWQRGEAASLRILALIGAVDPGLARDLWGKYAPAGFSFPR